MLILLRITWSNQSRNSLQSLLSLHKIEHKLFLLLFRLKFWGLNLIPTELFYLKILFSFGFLSQYFNYPCLDYSNKRRQMSVG